MTFEVLKRSPYAEWLRHPPFKGTYIIYDRPDRAYYVGESSKSVPARLRHHLTQNGVLMRHVTEDFNIPYSRKVVERIKRWHVAVTEHTEWWVREILRPIHGHRQRQSFYYHTVLHLGTLLTGVGAPIHGKLGAFIRVLNDTLNKRKTKEDLSTIPVNKRLWSLPMSER